MATEVMTLNTVESPDAHVTTAADLDTAGTQEERAKLFADFIVSKYLGLAQYFLRRGEEDEQIEEEEEESEEEEEEEEIVEIDYTELQITYITDEIIPRMIREEKIGTPDSEIVKLEVKVCEPDDDHPSVMGTTPFLVNLLLNNTNIRYSFIIKVTWQLDKAREAIFLDYLYVNEVTAYEKFVTHFKRDDQKSLFARYFFGVAENSQKDCVVIENLGRTGFKKSNERVFLPDDHIILALEALATFHSYSYILKEDQPEVFESLRKEFRETKYTDDKVYKPFNWILQLAMFTGLKNLKKYNEVTGRVFNHLSGLFKDSLKLMQDLVAPTEPLAVLCHGEFHNNNLLFKYEEELDELKTVGVKIIDLQAVRYASPSIDIAFLLFLNTTFEQRQANIDRYFEAYHKKLMKILQAQLPPYCDLAKYSLDAFLDDFAQHALFGYAMASFFLPSMLEITEWKDLKPEGLGMSSFYEKSKTATEQDLAEMKFDEVMFCLKDVIEHYLRF